MPVLPGRGDTLADLYDLIRADLNDPKLIDPDSGALLDPAVFTDAKLLPFVQSAYRRFQADLAANGVKILEANFYVTLPAGGMAMDLSGTAPNVLLPSDYLFPKWIRERPAGTSVAHKPLLFKNNGLSVRQLSTQLGEYEILGGSIGFIGATSDTELWMRYEKQLPRVTQPGDVLQILGSLDAIAYRGAAAAARSRGVAAFAADLEAQYQQEKALWLSRYWKPQQRTPARRRPYGSRRRVNYQ